VSDYSDRAGHISAKSYAEEQLEYISREREARRFNEHLERVALEGAGPLIKEPTLEELLNRALEHLQMASEALGAVEGFNQADKVDNHAVTPPGCMASAEAIQHLSKRFLERVQALQHRVGRL
jgi:hypothetical protein